MKKDENFLGGRLQLVSPDKLESAQHELYQYLVDTKVSWATKSGFESQQRDGKLIGPFNIYLYSPAISRALSDWGDAEAVHTSLPADVRQIVIMTVGVAWQADYEIYAHSAVGRSAGLSQQTIDSIIAGQQPTGLSREATTAYRFTRELMSEKTVSDETYAQAVVLFKEKGVVDMVQLIGMYLAISALLNAFKIPRPVGT